MGLNSRQMPVTVKQSQAMVHELLGMHNNIVDLKKATAVERSHSCSATRHLLHSGQVAKDARPELERIVMSPLQEQRAVAPGFCLFVSLLGCKIVRTSSF